MQQGLVRCHLCFFFFNDTATTEIYTLSLHDALPISRGGCRTGRSDRSRPRARGRCPSDRKSTRLNSSHGSISYAVFCLHKKTPHEHPRPAHTPTTGQTAPQRSIPPL